MSRIPDLLGELIANKVCRPKCQRYHGQRRIDGPRSTDKGTTPNHKQVGTTVELAKRVYDTLPNPLPHTTAAHVVTPRPKNRGYDLFITARCFCERIE